MQKDAVGHEQKRKRDSKAERPPEEGRGGSKAQGMVGAKYRLCNFPGCNKRPTFGTTIAVRCRSHKTDEMTDVKNKKCESLACPKHPSFGFPGEQVRFCRAHQLDGMVGARNKRCADTKCNRYAVYGLPDRPPTHCSTHKGPNMVDGKGKGKGERASAKRPRAASASSPPSLQSPPLADLLVPGHRSYDRQQVPGQSQGQMYPQYHAALRGYPQGHSGQGTAPPRPFLPGWTRPNTLSAIGREVLYHPGMGWDEPEMHHRAAWQLPAAYRPGGYHGHHPPDQIHWLNTWPLQQQQQQQQQQPSYVGARGGGGSHSYAGASSHWHLPFMEQGGGGDPYQAPPGPGQAFTVPEASERPQWMEAPGAAHYHRLHQQMAQGPSGSPHLAPRPLPGTGTGAGAKAAAEATDAKNGAESVSAPSPVLTAPVGPAKPAQESSQGGRGVEPTDPGPPSPPPFTTADFSHTAHQDQPQV
ncbi:unnamed protein product [Chrysoparadoxa australica]